MKDYLPKEEDRFYARIQFGRQPRNGDPNDAGRKYLEMEYPNLTYGGMVGVQDVLTRTALPEMVEVGKMLAALIGQPAGVPEIETGKKK